MCIIVALTLKMEQFVTMAEHHKWFYGVTVSILDSESSGLSPIFVPIECSDILDINCFFALTLKIQINKGTFPVPFAPLFFIKPQKWKSSESLFYVMLNVASASCKITQLIH